MSDVSRREFIGAAATAAVVAGASPTLGADGSSGGERQRSSLPSPSRPVVIASGNGMRATEKAMAMIQAGNDPLDAVIAGVNIVEEDPNDHSVGYGGIPNEDGVVELDSCVMHGPTHQAGAVAALRNIKTPSRVAKMVMERTDHVLLVGEGALRFARAHGFEEVNLLTDAARKAWLKWKERLSDRDDWMPPPQVDGDKRARAKSDIPFTYGTINCCAVTASGDLAGVTTTSGLSYKIPGRVGDSPIIGAGLFVDNAVGAAGSTGRGEAVIQTCGAHTVIEAMRHGMGPQEACLHALERIVDGTRIARLKGKDGRPNFGVTFYALAKDGRYGGATFTPGGKFTVFADGKNRHEDCAYLYKRGS